MMVAITIGWGLLGKPVGVALNGAWFAAAGAWWFLAQVKKERG